MKWAPIIDRGCTEPYAWKSDEGDYTVSVTYFGGESRFRGWFGGVCIHPGTFGHPKEAQNACEKHYAERQKK